MDVTETLYTTNRDEWRDWLEKHYRSADEIWLVNYRKRTGKPSVPYNDAVEEALCFGWIDSIVKRLDEERYVQRYTPRRAKSEYSQTNKERLKKLIEQGKAWENLQRYSESYKRIRIAYVDGGGYTGNGQW